MQRTTGIDYKALEGFNSIGVMRSASKDKVELSAKLKEDTQKFLAEGGEIEYVPTTPGEELAGFNGSAEVLAK